MIKEKYTLETTVIGSDDSQSTYEIHRTWNTQKKKAIIIELYPTISVSCPDTLDLSTLHLLNHMRELDIGSVRILNLYSKVQSGKPSATTLNEDIENLAYISDVFEEADISDYLIILAWGSSLSKHIPTINTKLHILRALKEKGLSVNTVQLFTEYLDTSTISGVHPLYMGLHFSKDIWSLVPYPIDEEITQLTKETSPDIQMKTVVKGGKQKKCTTESKTDLK